MQQKVSENRHFSQKIANFYQQGENSVQRNTVIECCPNEVIDSVQNNVYCGKYSICENCRNTNNILYEERKERNKHSDHIKCLLCTKNRRTEYGDYCWNHRTEYIRTEAVKQNKKVCGGGNRACVELLPLDYEHETCENCRELSRAYDNKRYKEKQQKVDKSRENNNEMSLCIRCGEVQKLSCFQIKSGELSRYCSSCRLKSCIYDKSRIRRNVKTNEKRIKYYIRNAKPHRRDKKWELTMEQALDIISKPCHYCGEYEENINDNGISYNNIGIDRVDNKKDYIIDNVVPACSMCNYMKYTHSIDKFIEFCINIYKNFGSKTEKQIYHRPYIHYKRDANKRKILFNIDHNTFDQILKYDCYYCNGKNNTRQIGIDRVDSDLPYCTKINTLVAACNVCNQMKRDYTLGQFYNQISKILLFNKKITNQEYNSKLKPENNTEVRQLILDLKKSENKKILNTVTNTTKEYSEIEKKYNDNVWNSFDCSAILPRIIICETNGDIDMWNFYRDSLHIKESKSKGLKIIITDENSNKHIGIMELSVADLILMESTMIKNFINTPINILNKNINNIVSVTACEPFQLFGHNFCGKTLLLKILFSKQMYDILCNKMNIYGYFCFSSESDMIQHYNIDELECLGYDPEIDDKNFDQDILKRITNYLKSQKVPIKYNYRDNVQIFRKYLDINDKSSDGQGWIHFGYTNKAWNQYFQSIDQTHAQEYAPKLNDIKFVTKNG